MTRVKASAELMEQLGIRAGQVRQETAVAIASVAPSHADGGPRTSMEMEEILRRAAAFAGERKAPATVADLLRAVLGLGRKAPSTALLMRAATDPRQLERWRDEPRRDASQALSVDASSRAGAVARSNVADALFKRLDSMEALLRAMQADMASERQAIMQALTQRDEPPADHRHRAGAGRGDRARGQAQRADHRAGRASQRAVRQAPVGSRPAAAATATAKASPTWARAST